MCLLGKQDEFVVSINNMRFLHLRLSKQASLFVSVQKIYLSYPALSKFDEVV